MSHFIFSWEFVIFHLNVLDNLDQDIFNTMLQTMSWIFKITPLSKHGHKVICLWLFLCTRKFFCESGSECVIPTGEDQTLLYLSCQIQMAQCEYKMS